MKRVYEPPTAADGYRLLVDRLWPRGLSRASAHVDEWAKDLAPSDELRRWYARKPDHFTQFRARYRSELLRRPERLADLVLRAELQTVTLVFAARDVEHSSAAVLSELLEESLG